MPDFGYDELNSINTCKTSITEPYRPPESCRQCRADMSSHVNYFDIIIDLSRRPSCSKPPSRILQGVHRRRSAAVPCPSRLVCRTSITARWRNLPTLGVRRQQERSSRAAVSLRTSRASSRQRRQKNAVQPSGVEHFAPAK